MTLVLFSCNNIEGFQISKDFDDIGSLSVDTSYFKYSPPENIFSINIPKNWEVQEDFTDTLYGVFFMDTASFYIAIENFQSLTITKHPLNGNLKRTFKKELELIKQYKNDEIIKIGKTKINGTSSFWMLTESKNQDNYFYNLNYFINKKGDQHVFLIQISVYKTDNYISRISNILPSVHTFKVN
jgi:hypothetical protein